MIFLCQLCCYPKINGQDKPVKQPQLSFKEIVHQVDNTVCWPARGLAPTDQLDMLLTVKSCWLLPLAHFCEMGAVHHWPNSWFTNTSFTTPNIISIDGNYSGENAELPGANGKCLWALASSHRSPSWGLHAFQYPPSPEAACQSRPFFPSKW